MQKDIPSKLILINQKTQIAMYNIMKKNFRIKLISVGRALFDYKILIFIRYVYVSTQCIYSSGKQITKWTLMVYDHI